MAKNAAFKMALANKKDLMAADPDARKKALDDLLQADPSKIHEVRTAIINNKGFWSLFPDLKETAKNKLYSNNNKLLTASGVTELRQAAAEQRVLLGLKDAADDVLIGILSNNQEECRAYLASKAELGNVILSEVRDPAVQLPPQPSNKITDLLSVAVIGTIQKQARDHLLSRYIVNTVNKSFLDQLLTANDQSTLKAAANQLGCPQALNDKLTVPLSAEVQGVLNQSINKLKQIEAEETFKVDVELFSTDVLLSKKSLLEGTNPNFKNQLLLQISTDFADMDVNWAKGVLGARYLQTFLSRTKADVLSLLTAASDEQFTQQLKGIAALGDHEYIEQAVKYDINLIKKGIVQSHIAHKINDPAVLQNLDKAPNIERFKEALVGAGVTPADWVKETDLKEIKQSVRSRLLECQLALVSQIGAEPHSKLAKVFAGLPVETQRRVLEDPIYSYHSHLLNAKDVQVLESYFGKEAQGLDEIIAENNKLAGFQQIQNAAVARILVNFKPEIHLDSDKINEINNSLVAAVSAGTDLNNPANYKVFIDTIRTHCDPVNPGHFYEAFGLNNDGLSFKADTSAKAAIIKQNNYNLTTASILNNDPNKKLLGVFLTLDKKEDLDPESIKTKFKTAKTYQEFIDGVVPKAKKALRAQLSSQLPSTLFYDLKVSEVNKKIFGSSSREFNEAIIAINNEIKSIQHHRETTTKSMKHVRFIEKIDPHHLYNPTFRGEARLKAAKMKDEYQSISDNCDDIVEQLRRDQQTLERFIPFNSKTDPALAQADKDKLIAIRQKLNKELVRIKYELRIYENIQNKLSGTNGILSAIADAADNKKAYVFQAEGVTRKFVTREELPGLAYSPTSKNTPTGIGGNPEGSQQQFELSGYVVPPGKIEAVDVIFTAYQEDKVTKSYETAGRYTVDRSPPAPVSITGEQITKTPGAKVEILEFPKQTFPAPNPQSPEGIELRQAKVHFALTVAADAIALLDGPPTKAKPLCLYGSNPEEMKYLWTALIILGEKNPTMKFGPEAIKLDRYGANNFDPAHEKSSFLGFNTGYTEKSAYLEFKSVLNQPEVDRKSTALNTMSEEKMRLFSQRSKVDPQVIEAAAALKKNNQSFREQAKNTKDTEEPVIKKGTGPGNG